MQLLSEWFPNHGLHFVQFNPIWKTKFLASHFPDRLRSARKWKQILLRESHLTGSCPYQTTESKSIRRIHLKQNFQRNSSWKLIRTYQFRSVLGSSTFPPLIVCIWKPDSHPERAIRPDAKHEVFDRKQSCWQTAYPIYERESRYQTIDFPLRSHIFQRYLAGWHYGWLLYKGTVGLGRQNYPLGQI